ncbi:MAG: hypothetical protein QM488_02320 [Rhizobiaceae bacterium]
MKLGVTLSSIAHVGMITWGLWSISGPKPFVVAEVEALSIDIVPIEEITKAVQGEKKADLGDAPAPTPTKKPTLETPAVNVGDTKFDIKTQEAKEKAAPVEATKERSAPKPQEQPPELKISPDPIRELVEKEEPVPTTELAALNEPKVPLLEKPADTTAETSKTAEKFAKLPDNVPTPTARPKPPKAKSAETKDRKKSKIKPAKKQDAAATAKKETTEDQIASLLNKQEPSAGGAKRSTKKTALGTKKGKAAKLSTSEMDGLRSAIEECASIGFLQDPGEDAIVTVTFRLTLDGEVDGRPSVKATGGEPRLRRPWSAQMSRAVLKCAPYSLPAEKYETWADVIVNFHPSQMF